jgi:hypothetical protein
MFKQCEAPCSLGVGSVPLKVYRTSLDGTTQNEVEDDNLIMLQEKPAMNSNYVSWEFTYRYKCF